VQGRSALFRAKVRSIVYAYRHMAQDPKSPLADRIEQIGDQADQVLGSVQSSVSKVLKRLAAIVGAVAIGIVGGNELFKAFQDKTLPVLERRGIEKVEIKPTSEVYRLRGR
jgi:hypothetical protein